MIISLYKLLNESGAHYFSTKAQAKAHWVNAEESITQVLCFKEEETEIYHELTTKYRAELQNKNEHNEILLNDEFFNITHLINLHPGIYEVCISSTPNIIGSSLTHKICLSSATGSSEPMNKIHVNDLILHLTEHFFIVYSKGVECNLEIDLTPKPTNSSSLGLNSQRFFVQRSSPIHESLRSSVEKLSRSSIQGDKIFSPTPTYERQQKLLSPIPRPQCPTPWETVKDENNASCYSSQDNGMSR